MSCILQVRPKGNSTEGPVYIQTLTFPETRQNYTLKLYVLITILNNNVFISSSITNAF